MNKNIFQLASVALLLTLIIVTLSVSVSGAAVAQESTDSHTELKDNNEYWFGMVLSREKGIEPSQSYSVLEKGSSSISQVQSNSDGELIIRTSGLSEGDFSILNRTSKEEIVSFSIRKQDLTISPSEQKHQKGSGGSVSYSISSNRDSYKLAVASSILSTEELKTVFNSHNPEAKDVVRDSREEVVLTSFSDTLNLNPSSLSANYYYLRYYVVDTEANAQTTLKVVNAQSQSNGGDDSSTSEYASITIEDRKNLSEKTVTEIIVDELDLSSGGFLVMYDDGQLTKTSSYISAGNYTNLRFDANIPIKSASTIKTIVYRDSNGDKQFTQGEDKPYQSGDSIVTATSQIHPKVTPTDDGDNSDSDNNDDGNDNDNNDDNNDDNNTTEAPEKPTDNDSTEKGAADNQTQQPPKKNNGNNGGTSLLPDSSLLLLILGGLGGLIGIIAFAIVIRKLIGRYIDTSTVKDKASEHLPLPPGKDDQMSDDNVSEKGYDESYKSGPEDEPFTTTEDSPSGPEDETVDDSEFNASPSRDNNFQTDADAESIQTDTDGPPDPKEYSETVDEDETDEESQAGSRYDKEEDLVKDEQDNSVISGEDETKMTAPDEVSLGSTEESKEITESSFTPPDEAANEYAEDESTESETEQTNDTEMSNEQPPEDVTEEPHTTDDETKEETDEDKDEDDDGDPLSDF